MRHVLMVILLLWALAVPASAAEFSPPEVPQSGADRMPAAADSFGSGLRELVRNTTDLLEPELNSAAEECAGILCTAMFFSLLPLLSEKTGGTLSAAGAALLAAILFQQIRSLVEEASGAVWDICEYGRLLCPVLTTALAAQGSLTASAALYGGTTAFLSLLNMLVSRWMVPMVYVFLAFSVANCALPAEILKQFADAVKCVLNWVLKTLLMVFTTYLSITGVVSGTTDLAATKAARLTISTLVPVVGNLLSDASESVVVSIGVMKNAAGVYGMLAVLAVFVGPFVRLGLKYLLLKLTAVLCSLFAGKNISALIGDFSTALGFLLAMVAVSCILVLISTICFLKGMG